MLSWGPTPAVDCRVAACRVLALQIYCTINAKIAHATAKEIAVAITDRVTTRCRMFPPSWTISKRSVWKYSGAMPMSGRKKTRSNLECRFALGRQGDARPPDSTGGRFAG